MKFRKGYKYAQLPDGSFASRKTNRPYKFVLAVLVDYADDRSRAQKFVDCASVRVRRYEGLIAGTISPDSWEDTQRSTWAGNLASWKRQEAEAVDKLNKIPSEGSYWSACSWHTRSDLAQKEFSKVTDPERFRIIPVVEQEVCK